MTQPSASQAFHLALDQYERAFDWIGLCLACGHAPHDTHAALQRLWRAHQQQRAGVPLFALVAAHWDVVNAAEAVAAAPDRGERDARQLRVRAARQAHADAVRALRRQLQPAGR